MGEETIGGYYHLYPPWLLPLVAFPATNKRASPVKRSVTAREIRAQIEDRESERVCVAGTHYEATVEGPFSRSRSQGCCRQKSHYVAALFELRESSGRVFAFCFYFNGRPLEVGMDWINHKRHIFFFCRLGIRRI